MGEEITTSSYNTGRVNALVMIWTHQRLFFAIEGPAKKKKASFWRLIKLMATHSFSDGTLWLVVVILPPPHSLTRAETGVVENTGENLNWRRVCSSSIVLPCSPRGYIQQTYG